MNDLKQYYGWDL